ncbi:MAG: hypothetical protein ACOYXM_09765 [Actinomycetota bacterium]
MPSITDSIVEVIRSLGNGGALANATSSLLVHQREEWLVDGLAARLDASARRDEEALSA